MKDDDALTTGALFVGGGAAGYAIGRFVLARWLDNRATTETTPGLAPPPTPAALPAPTAVGATAPPPTPATPAQARPSPVPTRPTRPARPASPPQADSDTGPVTSPAQVEQSVAPPSDGDVGPVTSPSEVDAPPTPTPRPDAESAEARADRRPSRRYDRIFDLYRGSIPIEYLRALSKRESGMNPEEQKGPAWGLMQIVEVVRKDYNERHGTKYTRQDLLDPAINVAMCCWLQRFIIAGYQKHHGDIPNMRPDWDNPRFAELLCFGWNAGFSSSGGVIKVVRYLKQRGHTDVTMDLVHQHARAAGASRHLSNAKKIRWCKSVVRLYEQERGSARNLARRT